MTRRFAREETLFAGTSSGANIVAALRIAEPIGSGQTVATLIYDTSSECLSTVFYSIIQAAFLPGFELQPRYGVP